MKTLVVGASGATGKHLVQQLLNMGQKVKVLVRSPENAPEFFKSNKDITIIKASISDMTEEEMAEHIKDCSAVASCLGHNLTFKGIFGKPRKLVRDAVRLMCRAIKINHPKDPVRVVLMNTTGNRNRDLNENVSFGEKLVFGLISLLLPPQSDNEAAADFLRVDVGQQGSEIEWVVVRPDSLIDEDEISNYNAYASPIRSAIFDPGKTSRINVGNFMARLMVENDLWQKWKGQMPVVYNEESEQIK